MIRLSRFAGLLSAAVVLTAVSQDDVRAQEPNIDTEFDSDGTTIHYLQRGHGEPVILLHGMFLNAESWMADAVLDSLAQDFQVIAMDVRGHGRSAKPHDPTEYGTEVISDVLRLMDHLQLETVNLVGYSMGGYLAMYLVTMFPDRVQRAVIGGAGMMTEGDGVHAFFAFLANRLESMEPSESLSDVIFPSVALDEDVRQLFDSNDSAAMAAIARGMLSLTIQPAALAENQVPVLLIVGDRDDAKPLADATLAVGNEMEMHILPGRDHLSAPSDPDFLQAIRVFLNR